VLARLVAGPDEDGAPSGLPSNPAQSARGEP